MTATIFVSPRIRFMSAAGAGPEVGGKVYFYAAGTDTPKDTWTTAAKSVANTNPVILDANGEADVYIDGNYKVKLTTSAGVQRWVKDNVSNWSELPTPQTGHAVYSADGSTWSTVSLSSVVPDSYGGLKNYLINGNFDLWTRGTSLTAGTSRRYLADRWYTGGQGSTIAPSRWELADGWGGTPFAHVHYVHRCVVASTVGDNNYAFLGQRIENVETLQGQVAHIGFWARADTAGRKIGVSLRQQYGSGGTPSSDVIILTQGNVFTLTTNFAYYQITTPTIPSTVGKTRGSDNNHSLRLGFFFDAQGSAWATEMAGIGSQSGTFDIGQAQLKWGAGNTAFDVRPLGLEKILAERFYQEHVGRNYFHGSSTTNTTIRAGARFRVPMRSVPSVTVYNGANANQVATVSGDPFSVSSVENITTEGFGELLRASGTSATTIFMIDKYTADAEL